MTFYNGYGNEIKLSAGNEAILTQRVVENPNLADPDAYEVGWVGTDGKLSTANTGTRTTDYIPCTPGQIVTVGGIASYNHNPWFTATACHTGCLGYCFFDGNKKAIGGASSRPNVSSGITVPAGAGFIRVTFFTDAAAGGMDVNHLEMMFVHVGDSLCTDPKRWFEDNVEKSYIPVETVGYTYPPPHFGKKWVLFGDSLTDAYAGKGWDASPQSTGGVGWTKDNTRVEWTGQLWASRIASELGLSIDNRAKSGSNINDGANGTYTDVSGIKMLDAYIAEVESGAVECADYITVGFGSNTRGDQVGSTNDGPTVVTSVYGAMKYFIERLRYLQKNYNQHMVFGFVLPPQSSWGQGNTRITEGRAAMLAVLNTDQYAVPYCDMWTESGICLDQMTDGIHVASIESNNLYYHAMRRFVMGL